MIKFEVIEIENFKSFKEKIIFHFEIFQNSFIIVSGPNGAGKSNFFEALCWCLFGQTTNKLKGPNVVCWNSKKTTKAKIIFNVDDNSYFITREQKPNRLLLDNKDVSQMEIEKLIGFNFELFIYSIFISQFGDQFFILDPAEKLNIFSKLLKLDKWLEYSDKSKDICNEYLLKVRNSENNLNLVTGQIRSLLNLNYDDQIKRWEEDQFEREAKITRQVNLKKLQISNERNELDELKTQLKQLNKEIEKQDIDELFQTIDVAKNEVKDHIKNLQKLSFQIESLEASKAYIDLGECRYCRSIISKDHRDTELSFINKEIKKLSQENIEIGKILKKDQQNISQLEIVVLKIENDLHKKSKEVKFDIKIRQEKVESLKVDIDLIEKEIEVLNEEENPFTDVKIDKDVKIGELKKQLERLNSQLIGIVKKSEIAKFWVKGFKEVRLLIIEEAVKEFQMLSNKYLSSLGFENWSFTFETNIDNKGKIKKGFIILVSSPNGYTNAPINAWSGGERQRLKLAATLGLSDFIRNRGYDTNIQIFDEPTQWLDEEGIEYLLQILKEKSLDTSIFLIDHKDSISRGCFDKTILVEKNDGESIVKYEN